MPTIKSARIVNEHGSLEYVIRTSMQLRDLIAPRILHAGEGDSMPTRVPNNGSERDFSR